MSGQGACTLDASIDKPTLDGRNRQRRNYVRKVMDFEVASRCRDSGSPDQAVASLHLRVRVLIEPSVPRREYSCCIRQPSAARTPKSMVRPASTVARSSSRCVQTLGSRRVAIDCEIENARQDFAQRLLMQQQVHAQRLPGGVQVTVEDLDSRLCSAIIAGLGGTDKSIHHLNEFVKGQGTVADVVLQTTQEFHGQTARVDHLQYPGHLTYLVAGRPKNVVSDARVFRLQAIKEGVHPAQVPWMRRREPFKVSACERHPTGRWDLIKHRVEKNAIAVDLSNRLTEVERAARLCRAKPTQFTSECHRGMEQFFAQFLNRVLPGGAITANCLCQ